MQASATAKALAAADGHRARAAGLLGIRERTLRYRLASLRDVGGLGIAA